MRIKGALLLSTYGHNEDTTLKYVRFGKCKGPFRFLRRFAEQTCVVNDEVRTGLCGLSVRGLVNG